MLVLMVDTLRPDHLGCYGYGRDTSPRLDRWAEDAALFERAYSHGTHTRIATASLFTGTLPTVHRIENVELKPGPGGENVTDGLAGSLTTWAESLGAAGYETWALSANPHITAELGFAQGFTHFWETGERSGGAMVDAFLARLEQRESDRPLFAYLHLMDPHNPYTPPVEYRYLFDVPLGKRRYKNGEIEVSERDLDWSVAQYDGEIRHLDDLLAGLLEAWEADTWRPRATLLISDHGEEFLEHGGMGHGTTVHEELARTALIAKGPGIAPGRRTDPVAHVDVHRLVLELAGVAPAPEAQGRPFSTWKSTEPELLTLARSGDWALRSGAFTLIEPGEGDTRAVRAWYDRSADPSEQVPRGMDEVGATSLADALAALRLRDAETARRLGTPERLSLLSETIGELKKIGYLGGDEH
ncbi:MAG: sulfatase [Planctomycetota bacterium]